jgi:hypothetical protein
MLTNGTAASVVPATPLAAVVEVPVAGASPASDEAGSENIAALAT